MLYAETCVKLVKSWDFYIFQYLIVVYKKDKVSKYRLQVIRCNNPSKDRIVNITVPRGADVTSDLTSLDNNPPAPPATGRQLSHYPRDTEIYLDFVNNGASKQYNQDTFYQKYSAGALTKYNIKFFQIK